MRGYRCGHKSGQVPFGRLIVLKPNSPTLGTTQYIGVEATTEDSQVDLLQVLPLLLRSLINDHILHRNLRGRGRRPSHARHWCPHCRG